MPEIIPDIVVLAGVNGAGKSSVAGAALRSAGGDYFNPDEMARRYREIQPDSTQEQANAWAWQQCRCKLETAISGNHAFRFETTLGGNTIPSLLLQAARRMPVKIFYVGLASPDLHLARVRERVARGGHDIPEQKIRERWENSLRNLISLLPHLAELRVFDNSAQSDFTNNRPPSPIHLLSMTGGKITHMISPPIAPVWVKPLLAAALRVDSSYSPS